MSGIRSHRRGQTPDGIVHVSASVIHGLQVKTRVCNAIDLHLENDHTAHPETATVSSMPCHLPFRPRNLAPAERSKYVNLNVGNRRQDLGPVPPHLVPPNEAANRVSGDLGPILGMETIDDPVQIMRIGSFHEALNH